MAINNQEDGVSWSELSCRSHHHELGEKLTSPSVLRDRVFLKHSSEGRRLWLSTGKSAEFRKFPCWSRICASLRHRCPL